MEGEAEFSDLPPAVQAQLAIFGPLLFGMIAGFLLSQSEVGYWIVTALFCGAGPAWARPLAAASAAGARPSQVSGPVLPISM